MNYEEKLEIFQKDNKLSGKKVGTLSHLWLSAKLASLAGTQASEFLTLQSNHRL